MISDLLIEIGCEELPPKALKRLGISFKDEIKKLCTDNKIAFKDIDWFAAPRRLAVLLRDVEEYQPDITEEKRGPSFNVAYDDDGNPTKAAQGWARSLGLALKDVDVLETDKGKWLYKKVIVEGKNIDSLIPDIVTKAVSRLPIPKMMRWGDSNYQFVRPVHSYCVVFGDRVLPATLFGIESGNTVLGHRFHSPDPITISHASSYQEVLESNNVVPDFNKRKSIVADQVTNLAESFDAVPSFNEDLLDEISALVEWPVTLTATFPESFLDVPKEALIYTMKDDQKYIPLLSHDGDLLDRFLFVSNISSNAPEKIVSGNERVIRPRLHDAQFFFNEDKKISSDTRLNGLKSIVYQSKLGTMYDRALRIANLSRKLAGYLAPDKGDDAYQAGLYAKSDLTSQMVYEFPSVQGSMGKYYGQMEGMTNDVCMAIEEHYLPKFAGDALPSNSVAVAAALADKLDQIVGIFSIGQIPTGDKDPFALRRCAIGILRICVEKQINVPLKDLIAVAVEGFPDTQELDNLINSVSDFVTTRLTPFYGDSGFSVKQINSVVSIGVSSLLDVDNRLQATKLLLTSSKSDVLTLAALNKRVANILKKEPRVPNHKLNAGLMTEDSEKQLLEAIVKLDEEQDRLIDKGDYASALVLLLGLSDLITEFFDSVMVNVEDNSVRENRLALLSLVRNVFTKVIDFAELD